VALLKGRENYICRRRLRHAVGKPNLLFKQEEWKIHLSEWASDALIGDLEDIPPELQAKIPKHVQLTSNSESCRRNDCYFSKSCFLNRSRLRAKNAKIILVNHHLFMADLSLRTEDKGLLPEWQAVVLDEAHLLEDTATSWFGQHIQIYEISNTLNQIYGLCNNNKIKEEDIIPSIIDYCNELHDKLDSLSELFQNVNGESDLYYEEDGYQKRNSTIKEILGEISAISAKLEDLLPKPKKEQAEGQDPGLEQAVLEQLGGEQADDDDNFTDVDDDERLDQFLLRLNDLKYTADVLADPSDPGYVYQVENRGQGKYITLSALPIEAGRIMGSKLKNTKKTVIFTSATLSTGGEFDFFKYRFNLPAETPTLTLSSPFDYQKNTILYVPEHMPGVNDRSYSQAFLEETVNLLKLSKGRALILFTSISRMKEVAAEIQSLLPWTVLMQSQKPKNDLLDLFKMDINSVLLATLSFWQGIDVPGESLSVVIIDRLPFTRPNQPLFKGRCRMVRERGLNDFMDYSIPEMTLTLRQGLGRLLRSNTDRGLLAIFDNRVTKSRYGSIILKSLPPSPLIKDSSKIKKFLKGL
jgi:ATP-dependent DNA helicase DinG